MNWHIKITGTNLSEEAQRICFKSDITSIDQLIDKYNSDNNLSFLSDPAPGIREEISAFIRSTLAFFKTVAESVTHDGEIASSQSANKEVPGEIISTNKPEIFNPTIEVLRSRGLITVRLYNICLNNRIYSLQDIFNEFRKANTFAHFKNAGTLTDDEIIGLIRKYDFGSGIPELNSALNLTGGSGNSFSQYIDTLPKEKYSLSINYFDDLSEISENDLFLYLCEKYHRAAKTRGLGNKKVSQIRDLIFGFFSLPENITEKQLSFFKNLDKRELTNFTADIRSLFKAHSESVISLIWYLYVNNTIFKSMDYVYLNSFLCFFEDSKPRSYSELGDLLRDEFGWDINLNTVRVQVKRTRDRSEELFENINTLIDRDKLFHEFGIDPDSVGFLMEPGAIDDLNSGLPKNLSKEFYRYLLRAVLKDKMTDYREKNDVRTYLDDLSLLFLRKDLFSQAADSLAIFMDLYNSVHRIESVYKAEDLIMPEGETGLRNLLIRYLECEFERVKIERDQIKILPNSEPKCAQLIYNILKDLKKPQDYDEIVRLFDEKYPGKRSSYRSLRDAMHCSPLFMTLVGRSNKYFLKEWEDEIITGPVKELVIGFYQKKKDSAHFYEVYREVSRLREGITLSIIRTMLGAFQFFYSEGGGFYYYCDFPPAEIGTYPPSINGLNSELDKIPHEDLTVNRESVIQELLSKHPDFARIQIEYAVDREAGVIDL